MTRYEIVLRARRALEESQESGGVIYALGKGGFKPGADVPWNDARGCDCSGFVAWCLGLNRHTDHPWYREVNGGWLETTAIVHDALGPFGMFDAIPLDEARPADVIVYGDKDGHQGHVGLIVATNPEVEVIHCSSGNFKATKNALASAGPDLWLKRGGIVARCAMVDE